MTELTDRGQAVALIPLLGLFVWDLNDGSGPKGVPTATLALFVVGALYGVAVLRRHSMRVSVPRAPLFLVSAMLVIGTLMIFARDDFFRSGVLQDTGTLAFFILCLYIAQQYAEELMSYRTLVWFTVIYVAIAVFSYYAASLNLRPEFWWRGRWDPPYYPVFGALALLARYGRTFNHRVIAVLVTLPMLWLAFASGNRTQFLLGVICLLIVWGSHVVVMWALATATALVAFLASFGVVSLGSLTSLVQGSRFSSLESGDDVSLSGRFAETSDILQRIKYDDSALQTVFGRGAGAMWEPITRRLDGLPDQVFYLHSGPTALTYRYGVLGVLIFVYFGWIAVRAGMLAVGSKATPPEKLWLLGGVGFFVNYFFQNSMFDPPAVLAMAATILLISRIRARDITASRPRTADLSALRATRRPPMTVGRSVR